MEKYKILDCTLRDGGYVNEWSFSKKVANEIVSSLSTAGVEIVECGYLTQKGSKENSTLLKDIEAFENYFSQQDADQQFVLMINQGDFYPQDLPEAHTNRLSGIRLAFHKKNILNAVRDAKIIQEKGYKVFFQPMVVKSYSEQEFIALIEHTNELNPYAFYIVDSFGSLDNYDFLRYLYLADHILEYSILLGFHGHNNMQYAYANAINLIVNSINRNIIIDSSIFGMGRGAGNLNTEVIASYLNKYYSKQYIIEPLLEVMDDYLEPIYMKQPWGFTAAQFLSAKHECHPSYASFLTTKKKLAIAGINSILSKIDDERRNSFSIQYISDLYLQYNKAKNNNINLFDMDSLHNKEIILIGSGKSVNDNLETIKKLQNNEGVVTVILNHINHALFYDYIFFANQKRYTEYYKLCDENKIIVTSNLNTDEYEPLQIDFSEALEKALNNYDNVLALFLSCLSKINVKKVYLAGIDGYAENDENYGSEDLVLVDKGYMLKENDALAKTIRFFAQSLSIEFITPSVFKGEVKRQTLGVIPARYQSSRFEGKPLCLINGIPMIKRTYDQANKAKLLDKLVVATDDDRIQEYCIKESIPVIMTSDQCLTGTDRIAEVSERHHYDLYINIQGDEPVIDPAGIDEIIEEFNKYGNEYSAYNLYKIISDDKEVASNTIIKTIVNEKDELMYMSRIPVPFDNSKRAVKYKKQVCVYGFTKQSLEVFSSRDKTLNEKFEDIEILRFLDMGFKVKMKETTVDSIAVDIPEDVVKVEKHLKQRGLQ